MMTNRSAALATQFEQAVTALDQMVTGLSDAEWRRLCPGEQSTIGVVVGHVAVSIPFEMDVFRQIAAGRQPAMFSMDDFDKLNAEEAIELADINLENTLALLRANADAAAREVRGLTPTQLGRAGQYVIGMEPWTVERWIEGVLVGHVIEHHKSIKATLATTGA